MKFLLAFLSLLCLVSCAHKKHRYTNEDRAQFVENPVARAAFLELRNQKVTLTTKQLLDRVTELSKQYPNEVVLKGSQAALTGDYGQTLSAKEEGEYKAKAVAMLKPLLERKFTNPIGYDRILVFNEYYYHSGQYLKQYQLGLEVNKKGGLGYYSTGVGSSMHAFDLYKAGKKEESKKFAKESVAAWLEHSDGDEAKINDDSFYLLALALSGQKQKAVELYSSVLMKAPYYKEAKRWCETLNPNLVDM